MPPVSRSQALLTVISNRCSPEAGGWLEGVMARLQGSPDAVDALDLNEFARAYTGARRRLGDAPVHLEAPDIELLSNVGVGVESLDGAPLHEVFRIALLLFAGAGQANADPVPFLRELYQRGDNYERQAILRGLYLLDDPARFAEIGVEACRSHVQIIFEAIACNNPYPSRHFSDLHFNQMVLKALFTGVPLSSVTGLKERITPDLIRMAQDYGQERRSADRSVPEDIDLLSALYGARNENV